MDSILLYNNCRKKRQVYFAFTPRCKETIEKVKEDYKEKEISPTTPNVTFEAVREVRATACSKKKCISGRRGNGISICQRTYKKVRSGKGMQHQCTGMCCCKRSCFDVR